MEDHQDKEGDGHQQDQGKTRVHGDHHGDDAAQKDDVGKYRIQTSAQQFFQDLHVAGHPGHDPACLAVVEEAEGKVLQMAEQIPPEGEENAVSDARQEDALRAGGGEEEEDGAGEGRGHRQETGCIGVRDVFVNAYLHKQRQRYGRARLDQGNDPHEDDPGAVGTEVGEEPLEQ